jgi:DNA-binding NtrC family response regulator
MRARLESLIDEMLDGHILLDEALCEFEKLYIKKALARHNQHLSNTAAVLGIHRNTLAKRVATYKNQESPQKATKSITLTRTSPGSIL